MPDHAATYTSRAGNIRHIALAWLRGENRYQFSKFSRERSIDALDEGIRASIWGSEIGNYPLRAAMAHEAGGSMQALQAAGKSAAVCRALYTVILQLRNPGLSIEYASQQTLQDLEAVVPGAAAPDFTYVGARDIKQSPLWEGVVALDESLLRPIRAHDVGDEQVQQARTVCLAGVDLMLDYAFDLLPRGSHGDWPRPGLPSGQIESWTPSPC